MAKKAVATLQQGAGRSYSKVIKMVKSPKTGAYVFQEEIVHNDNVKEFFKYESDNIKRTANGKSFFCCNKPGSTAYFFSKNHAKHLYNRNIVSIFAPANETMVP